MQEENPNSEQSIENSFDDQPNEVAPESTSESGFQPFNTPVNNQPDPIATSPNNTVTPVTGEPIAQPIMSDAPQSNTPDQSQFVGAGLNTQQIYPAPGTPLSPQNSVDQSGLLPKKVWWKTKAAIIGIVAAVIVVIGGGIGVFAYTSYQTPEKVLADSIINVFTAKASIYKGKLVVDNTDSKVKVTVDVTTKQAKSAGSLEAQVTIVADSKTYSATGDALFDDKGDLYFRVGGLTKIVSEAETAYGIPKDSQIVVAIDKTVKKIDNTWIKISSDDLKEFSEGYATTQNCVTDTIEKFKNDDAAIQEVATLYRKNSFIVIKKELGTKDGSFGYEVKGDSAALKTFTKGLKDTKVYKSLQDCDKTFVVNENDIDTTNSTSSDDAKVELWIDTWSHRLTKIDISSTSKTSPGSLVLEAKYDETVTIKAPANSISLAELKSYIEEISTSLSSLYQTSSSSMYDSSTYPDVPTSVELQVSTSGSHQISLLYQLAYEAL